MQIRGALPQVGLGTGRLIRPSPPRTTIRRFPSRQLCIRNSCRRALANKPGWSEPDARAEARRRFGDLAAVGARCRKLGLEHERNVRRAEYLAELRQDVRLAFRHLRWAPAFAAVAVLTLVLAIGANTAIFSAVSAVLLRPCPIPTPAGWLRSGARGPTRPGSCFRIPT